MVPKSPKKKVFVDENYENKPWKSGNLEIELEEASTIADDNESIFSFATEGAYLHILNIFATF